ncbi:MAG: 50S ribosomal protein L13 [Armatimonadota bacterium]|nr:50S ribosomal protein L13 [Armatimonadota bacterium]MDR7451992.1 50S ribosomal protein L13 [Armatimonadota bacterium]MDR7467883.1 50S ribosomal protein L13 [Armatimonadota bacterium]MDR7494264.1 50S ribosomal protein L13 [Armatimonadota bacterium]MDR7500045.1 50S ribosomal protein L13 [Armatimonadota bacterium]
MKTMLPREYRRTRRWYVVDADGQVLGRLATRVAALLRGKHKALFTPHLDAGDGVIVVNAEKVRVTGRKAERKIVYRHSGYPGGLKARTLGSLLKTRPERVITDAVRGMLPQTPLGDRMIRRLKVYRGAEHPHRAQQPAMVSETR